MVVKVCRFHTSPFSCSSSAKNTAARSSAFKKRGGEEEKNKTEQCLRIAKNFPSLTKHINPQI